MSAFIELPDGPDSPLLLHGDCLELLRRLPDGSIDVVITDPPAGIGFMHSVKAGRTWDSFAGYEPVTERGKQASVYLGGDPLVRRAAELLHGLALPVQGEALEVALRLLELTRAAPLLPAWARGFVLFMVDVWTEVDRVLKPGGWVCAWALPKTADLAGLAMRACGWATCSSREGWTIHDSLLHLFGCLADDAEILTDIGWVHGRSVDQARLALCYDVDRGTYEWQPIERTVRFPFSGTAYRVHGDGVDHTVTPDHRCVDIGPDGGRFIDAIEAARQPAIHVPVPDGLLSLRIDVAGDDARADAPGQDVRESLRGRTDPSGANWTDVETEALRDLRSALLAAQPDTEPSVLLAPLLRAMAIDGHGHPQAVDGGRPQGQVGLDRDEHGQLPAENVGSEQPGVEGRSDDAPRQGQLRGPALRPMPAGVSSDGAQGRVCDGTSPGHGASARTAAHADGVRAPHESRPAGQPATQPGTVQDEPGSQNVRGPRGTTSVAARVEPVAYDGFMWCVTVKTGAFVARANGLPFVTGNSGFPKSHNVSKALDALAGAEREVLSTRTARVAFDAEQQGGGGWAAGRVDVTAPATSEAQRWDGWGTALAPGHEQWLLARKPTPLTYAKQVLAHGCGAMNIDATRTPAGEGRHGARGCAGQGAGMGAENTYNGVGGVITGEHPGGRWPANVLLTEGGERCPVAELDRQSGYQRDGVAVKSNTAVGKRTGEVFQFGNTGIDATFGSGGGASRYFPRFRYQAKAHDRTAGLRTDTTNKHPTHKSVDLMRWLVRLLAANAEHTGGEAAIVLDPFMGSGTTGIACVAERVRFIGIERDPVNDGDHDSYGIAVSRIMAAIGSPEAASEANEKAPSGGQLALL